MKKFISLALIAVLVISVCSFGGCRTKDNLGDYPVTVGNTTFSAAPKKVVVLSDSLADIVLSCGYSTSLVARSDECTQKDLKVLPSVGSKSNPDTEYIASVGAELVFADETLSEDSKTFLKAKNIKVLSILPASTREEISNLYSNICAIYDGNKTGKEKGIKKAENLFLAVDDINRQIPESNVLNTACYIYGIEGNICTVVTGESFANNIFSYANCSNIAAGGENGIIEASIIKLQNPKFIFCNIGVSNDIKNHSILGKLEAVTSGNLFELEASSMTRQGDTILETVKKIVIDAYPDLLNKISTASDTETEPAATDSEASANKSSDTDSLSNTDSEVSSAAGQSGKKYYVSADGGLNLREAPDGEVITLMENSTIVTVIDDSNDQWFKVKLEDGTEGYCSSEFIQPVQ